MPQLLLPQQRPQRPPPAPLPPPQPTPVLPPPNAAEPLLGAGRRRLEGRSSNWRRANLGGPSRLVQSLLCDRFGVDFGEPARKMKVVPRSRSVDGRHAFGSRRFSDAHIDAGEENSEFVSLCNLNIFRSNFPARRNSISGVTCSCCSYRHSANGFRPGSAASVSGLQGMLPCALPEQFSIVVLDPCARLL